jgi:hypothetical protein
MSTESPGSVAGEQQKYGYSVDGVRYHWDKSSITGAQIKASIPNLNPTFQLFREGTGGQPDKLVNDSDSIDLAHTAPHLYTAPPATFGA